MDFRVLLIQSIALLYWESTVPNSGFDSRRLILDIVNGLPSPDSIAGTDDDRENLAAIRGICLTMATTTQKVDREFLENKLKLNIKKDPELRQDVMDSLTLNEESEDAVIARIRQLQRELDTWLYQKAIKEDIKKIASKTIFAGAPSFEVAEMAKEIIKKMERYVDMAATDGEDPSVHMKGDTDDLEELAKHFTGVQEDLSPDSVIKTGWQGLNRMFGEVGGIRRGNMYVIGARSSNGKSLVSSCITLHACLYNTPYMFDKTKKPCVVHISTENDVMLNLKIWFRYLWECEYNQPCNLEEHDPASMAKWFKERITRNGYRFLFYYVNPRIMTYDDIISRLLKIEADGYEIHLCTVDYLMMLVTEGGGGDSSGLGYAFMIQGLFRAMRQHCNPRKIALITPHQLNTESAALIRQGATDFVQQVAGKRYWMYSRGLDTEVDCEIIVNIEQDQAKNSYMAFGRGKDRTSQNTPEKDKFFFLPFNRIGGLRPDINGKDTTKHVIRDTMVVAEDWRADAGSTEVDY